MKAAYGIQQTPEGTGSGLKVYKSGKKAINERINERQLMVSKLSNDLKVSTYELQMLKGEEDVANIFQTAEVLEDILQVVTGVRKKYPFGYKKPKESNTFKARAVSI